MKIHAQAISYIGRLISLGKRVVAFPSRFRYPNLNAPIIKTGYRSANTSDFLTNLSISMQDAPFIQYIIDYQKSKGSYFTDVDGNVVLDLNGQNGTMALGYNHPSMIKTMKKKKFDKFLLERPSIEFFQTEQMIDTMFHLKKVFSPSKYHEVQFVDSGTIANELAFQLALNKKQQMEGLSSKNELKILAFENSFHGTTLATLSASHSPIKAKEGLPLYNWPEAPFPKLQYPYENFLEQNIQEEKRVLEWFEAYFTENAKNIAGLIIEPIQSMTNNICSNDFYQQLRIMASKYKIPFIVDEINTGMGSTGKLWGFEHWNLETPPDIITFGKKASTGGIIAFQEFMPEELDFNKYSADPLKIIYCNELRDILVKEHVMDVVESTGNYLMEALQSHSKIKNVRGKGTFIGFEIEKESDVVPLFGYFRSHSINLVPCNSITFSLRPPLTLTKKDADHFLDILNKFYKK